MIATLLLAAAASAAPSLPLLHDFEICRTPCDPAAPHPSGTLELRGVCQAGPFGPICYGDVHNTSGAWIGQWGTSPYGPSDIMMQLLVNWQMVAVEMSAGTNPRCYTGRTTGDFEGLWRGCMR